MKKINNKWIHTKEEIERMKKNMKGSKTDIKKGKTYEDFFGKEKAKEIKRKLSEQTSSRSQEIFDKISKALKGRVFSEEHKKKLSKNHRLKRGYPNPMTGNGWRVKGEKSGNWQGGISDNPYPIDWTENLKESIRMRDNFICQLCGIHQNELEGWNKKLDIHHIDYNKDNLNSDNLLTLCRNCHVKTNYNRKEWTKYFKEELEI